jgi:F-type H+-transporting ATPase subunit b
MVKVIPDISLIIQVVNFLFLMIALNLVLYRPIRRIMKERKERFAAFESDITSLTGRVDDRLRQFEQQLVEARREGLGKKDDLKAAGLTEEKGLLSAASASAEAQVQKARDQVKADMESARTALSADIQVFSRDLAQKVLGRSLS